MKKYRVNVNGTAYEIEIEELNSSAPAQASAPTQAPTPAKEEAPAPAATPAGAGEKVESPMPGTIISVNVTAGQAIKKGQVLMILEAMKMENEIMAAKDGVVESVCVSNGTAVVSGTVLCTIA